jgi:hypothetical protein
VDGAARFEISRSWSVRLIGARRVAVGALIGFSCLFSIGWTLRFVGRYAVNVPFLDQWDPIRLFREEDVGKLSLDDFWAPNNVHRMLFSKLLMFALAHLTQYDVVQEVYVFIGLLVVALAILLVAVRRTFGYLTPLAAVVPILLFYPRQWIRFLPGIEVIPGGLVLVGGFLGSLLLSLLPNSRRWPFLFAGAVVCASVASLSGASGFATWPAGAVVIFMQRARHRLELLGVWLALGATEAFLCQGGLPVDSSAAKPSYLVNHPLASLRYLMTLLGASLTNRSGRAAIALGIVFTIVAAAALVLAVANRKSVDSAFWAAVIVFSFGMAVLVTAGRGWLGSSEAFASRYVTLTLPLSMGAAMLLGQLYAQGRSGRSLAASGIVLLFACVAFGLRHAYDDATLSGRMSRDDRNRMAFALLTWQTEPDAILVRGHYPDPLAFRETGSLDIVIRRLAPVLARRNYSVFAPSEQARIVPPPLRSLQELRASSTCHIDSADVTTGTLRTRKTSVLSVQGWCIDPAAHSSAGGAYLVVDGRRYPAEGVERPDVAAAKGGSYRDAGFVRFLALPRPRRFHTVSVIAVARDKRDYYAPTRPLRVPELG